MKDLDNIIKNIQKDLREKVISLNSGGCVHFAYFLSRKLNSLGIKNYIIFEGTRDKNDSCSHALVKIEGHPGYIDGYKTSNYCNSYHYKHKNYSDINRLRKNKMLWNCIYNIKNNSLVSKIINKHFNGYRGT